MTYGLWDHALHLASGMDQRTYAIVKARFENKVTMNNPLQTLYHLMSGRQPAAVTVSTFFNELICKAGNLTAICEQIIQIVWGP
jgi:hypothetical protein